MAKALPFEPSTPFYTVSTTLSGTVYILNVRWNGRDEAWYFDLLASDGSPIRIGIKVVLGALLGGRCVDPRFPPGRIIAGDLSGEGRDATIDDIGRRVMVYYYENAELEP